MKLSLSNSPVVYIQQNIATAVLDGCDCFIAALARKKRVVTAQWIEVAVSL